MTTRDIEFVTDASTTVVDVMTPVADLVTVPATSTREQIKEAVLKSKRNQASISIQRGVRGNPKAPKHHT